MAGKNRANRETPGPQENQPGADETRPTAPVVVVRKRTGSTPQPGDPTVLSNAAAMASAAPPQVKPIVLYDLVCPIEGRIKTGLTFEACLAQAREHNRIPGHDADCFKRRTPTS
jgi:hypothetical protein